MSLRKQIQEVNRTRRRLAGWLDRNPQGPALYALMLESMVEKIARKLNAPESAVRVALTEPPFSAQVSAFLYEETLLKPWSAQGSRPIDDFISKQARRERPLGRRFLTALAKSIPAVWEIVDVDPGNSLSVRPLREKPTTEDKVRRVYDVLASESISSNKYLFGRVLRMPEGRIFAASILPIRHSDALLLRGMPEPALMQAGFVDWGLAVLLPTLKGLGFDQQGISSTPMQDPAKSEKLRLKDGVAPAQPASTDSGRTTSARPEQGNQHGNGNPAQSETQTPPADREKLLERIRRLFAMAQETEASPHEAEIALRRCQKLMARFGIQESDLQTSQFSAERFRAGNRVPMHIKWLAAAVKELHSVLFVTGGRDGPEFRGFEIDVKVAKMTMEYLENATERSLATRRLSGTFPAGRSAAYDYRVSFAMEVRRRVLILVAERTAAEAAAIVTGTGLTVRKTEIVRRECAEDLVTKKARFNGARPGEAADAGRLDGSKVSLDPQVEVEN